MHSSQLSIGIFQSRYPGRYAATLFVGIDIGGVITRATSVVGSFSTFVATGFTYFAIATLLMSSNILSLSTLQLLLPLWTKSLSAKIYLNASLNWTVSGLSLKPPFPRMILNKFSAQSWFSLFVNRNLKFCSVLRYSHKPNSAWIHNFHPNIQGSTISPSVFILSRNFKLSLRNAWWKLESLNAFLCLCELFSF